MTRRRTQEERRQETIGKLLDATIEMLAERGYADTSTSKVAKRAGVSQGALFNHFDSRIAVIVAATERICQQHIDQFEQAATLADDIEGDLVAPLVEFVRTTSRSTRHAAWHEVMVAARTDDELRDGVRQPLHRFEQGLLATMQRVFEVPDDRMGHVGAVVLSMMHMFDSEAVTVAIVPNDDIEQARVDWAARTLREAMKVSADD